MSNSILNPIISGPAGGGGEPVIPTSLSGQGMLWPFYSVSGPFTSTSVQAATSATAKTSACGRVWYAGTAATKSITKIWMRVSSRTVNASSQWRVSLQDVDLAAGPPMRPDGVVDQSYTSAVGFAPTANAWLEMTLDAPRTVAIGEFLAVVHEFTTFVSTNFIDITATQTTSTNQNSLLGVTNFNGTTWSAQSQTLPMFAFQFSDGTFGTLFGSPIIGNPTTTSYSSSSTGSGSITTGNERGLEFTPAVSLYASGIVASILMNSGAALDCLVYEDGTLISTTLGDNNVQQFAGGNTLSSFPFAKLVFLQAGKTYRIMLRAVNTTSSTLYYYSYGTNVPENMGELMPFGSSAKSNSRTGAGAFGAGSSTLIPAFSLVVA